MLFTLMQTTAAERVVAVKFSFFFFCWAAILIDWVKEGLNETSCLWSSSSLKRQQEGKHLSV